MTKFKSFLRSTALVTTVFALSGGITYLICFSQKGKNVYKVDDNVILTPTEKLLNSMTNLGYFDFNASVKLNYQKTTAEGLITFKGSGNVSNLASPQLEGDFTADMANTSMNAHVGYYDNNIYVDFNDSYFYVPVNASSDDTTTRTYSTLVEFINTLPSMGLNIDLPASIKNLNLKDINDKLETMTEIKDLEGYYFTLDLDDTIQLVFTTDDEFNFTGIRTNRFFYKDLYCQAVASIEEKTADTTSIEKLQNPETKYTDRTYHNFAPAFNLFEGMYNLFNSKKNAVNLNLNLGKSTTDTNNVTTIDDIASVDLDLSYDIDNSVYGIRGAIKESGNTHEDVMVALKNKTLFVNYNELIKAKLANENLAGVIEYFSKKITSDDLKNVIDKISTSSNNIDIVNVITNLTNLNNLIKNVSVTDETMAVTIDLESLNDLNLGITIKADAFTVNFNYSSKEFTGVNIQNFNFDGYTGSLALNVISDTSSNNATYRAINIDSEEEANYADLAYPLGSLEHIYTLTSQEKFKFSFEGSLSDTSADSTSSPFNIDGSLQFDVKKDDKEKGNGYGYVNIAANNRTHNIIVDVKEKSQALFKYGELKGKFTTDSVLDTVDLIKETVNDKNDEHFQELFGSTLETLEDSQISQIIADKNYGKLLTSGVVSNLKTSQTETSLDINTSILGLTKDESKETFTLTLSYDYDEAKNMQVIKGIEVENLYYNDELIEFKINLEDYDESLETSKEYRLPASDDYLDFSDIAVLLRFGINTSKVNDWHLTGKVGVSLALGSWDIMEEIVTVDIKINNIKGKVQAIIELPDVPIIKGVNGAKDSSSQSYYDAQNRKVVFYYNDGYVYGYRSETVRDTVFSTSWWKKYYTYEASFKATQEYFFDNIIDYLCDFGLGLTSTILDQINTSTSEGPTEDNPINYDKILTDFNYNKDSNYFYLSLNAAELTKNDDLKTLNIKVYKDQYTYTDSNKTVDKLSALNIYFVVDVGVSIILDANLSLVDFNTTLDMSKLNTYVASKADATEASDSNKYTQSWTRQ